MIFTPIFCFMISNSFSCRPKSDRGIKSLKSTTTNSRSLNYPKKGRIEQTQIKTQHYYDSTNKQEWLAPGEEDIPESEVFSPHGNESGMSPIAWIECNPPVGSCLTI